MGVAGLSACKKSVTSAEKRELINAQLWPEGWIDDVGNLLVRWPASRSSPNENAELHGEAVNLRIPAVHKPSTATDTTSDKRIITQIYIQIELHNLTPWTELPPLPLDVADGPRLYSTYNRLFGLPAKSIEDPDVRRDVEAWRHKERTYKRVRLSRHASYRREAERRNKLNFLRTFQLTNIQATTHRTFAADGEVGGLLRYSLMVCADPARLVEPEIQEIFQLREPDDPSPKGCKAIRNSAVLVSRPNTLVDDWVFIECNAPLLQCTAHFQAAKRAAQVDFWSYDLPRWRETVDPIRSTLNGFVISD